MVKGSEWESPLERIFREERQRRKLFEDAARPLRDAIGLSGTGAWAEMERQSRSLADLINDLTDPPGLRMLRETALQSHLMTQHLAGTASNIQRQFDAATKALGPILDQLAGGLNYHGRIMREARGASEWAEQMSRTAAAAAFVREDINSSPASSAPGDRAKSKSANAKRMARLERSLQKLAASTTPTQTARYLAQFFKALSDAVSALSSNTVEG